MNASLHSAKMKREEYLSAQDVSLSIGLSDLVTDVGKCTGRFHASKCDMTQIG